MDMFICINESLCCPAEIKYNIVNQLHFNKILKKKKYIDFNTDSAI